MNKKRLLWLEINPDTVLEISKQYKKRSDWTRGHDRSYRFALRRPELFKRCVAHMPPPKTSKKPFIDTTTGVKYQSLREAHKELKINWRTIHSKLKGNIKKETNRFIYE